MGYLKDSKAHCFYDDGYPSCCSVLPLVDFNRDLDDCDDEDYEYLKDKLKESIEGVKRGEYHTVAMAIVIREQARVIQALQELGFYQSPKFMRKTGYSKGGSYVGSGTISGAHCDTIIFFLPLGDEVD